MDTLREIPQTLASALGGEPLQQGSFPWNRSPWQDHMHDLPEVLEMLATMPDRVDRHSTLRTVQGELERGRVLPAFVAVMVWGYGTTGFGPLRTRWILTGVRDRRARQHPVSPHVAVRLGASAALVREEGPVPAFRLMNNDGKVAYLGAAYFTKWLYFASALHGPEDVDAAPILDRQVARWLATHADVELTVNRTASYATYLDLLSGWGRDVGRAPVQVETAIFRLATGRG